MRTVRVALASWQPPSTCACCLQGTSSRVDLSPRGIDVRGAAPAVRLPLCPACREHVLFEQHGGERRITLITTLGIGLGILLGAGAGFLLTPARSPLPAYAVALVGATLLSAAFGPLTRRMASRSRPYELLDGVHTRPSTPAELSVAGAVATLTLHSDVFARLVAEAHAPRSTNEGAWLR